jgi:hypothetical protein
MIWGCRAAAEDFVHVSTIVCWMEFERRRSRSSVLYCNTVTLVCTYVRFILSLELSVHASQFFSALYCRHGTYSARINRCSQRLRTLHMYVTMKGLGAVIAVLVVVLFWGYHSAKLAWWPWCVEKMSTASTLLERAVPVYCTYCRSNRYKMSSCSYFTCTVQHTVTKNFVIGNTYTMTPATIQSYT